MGAHPLHRAASTSIAYLRHAQHQSTDASVARTLVNALLPNMNAVMVRASQSVRVRRFINGLLGSGTTAPPHVAAISYVEMPRPCAFGALVPVVVSFSHTQSEGTSE